MRHTRTIIATFIIAILAISSADSAPVNSNGNLGSQQFKPGNNVFKPVRTSIQIGTINYGSAAPGNSEPVTVMVSVVSSIYPQGICGLKKDNFKIEVPTHGFGFTSVVIKNVLGVASASVDSPTASCGYGIQIAPGVFQGKQYKWANSPGAFNLYYFVGNNQIAVATFNLNMYAS